MLLSCITFLSVPFAKNMNMAFFSFLILSALAVGVVLFFIRMFPVVSIDSSCIATNQYPNMSN